MIYRVLANLVVILHLAFIAFVVAGGVFAIRWRWVAFLHLPAVLWAIFIERTSGVCPLTPLENALRAEAGEAGYPGGFVEHYLIPVIYPSGLTPERQDLLATAVGVVNVVVYAWVGWRRHAFGRSTAPPADRN